MERGGRKWRKFTERETPWRSNRKTSRERRVPACSSEGTRYCIRQHSNADTRVYIIYSELLSSALRQVSHLEPSASARLRRREITRGHLLRSYPFMQLTFSLWSIVDIFFINFYNGDNRIRIYRIIIIVIIEKIILLDFRDIALSFPTMLQKRKSIVQL